MYVIFGVLRQVVVHDVLHVGNVQPTACDVRAYEHRKLAFLEIHEHPQALFLWYVARDRRRLDAIRLKIPLNTLGFTFHVDEHHNARITHFPNQTDEQWHFVFVRREEYCLANAIYRDFVRLDTHEIGLVHMLVREFHNALRQRRREQHIETFVRRRQPPQQVANILDEAEVKHAVCLVEHGDLNLVELEYALFEVIDDAPGRTDQNVDTRLNVIALLLVVRATESEADNETRVPAECLRITGDLHRKLACWRQHERTRLLLTFRRWLGLQKSFEGGNQECGRLASPGLRLAGNIPLFKGDRQGTRLNWRTKFEAHIADSRVYALIQRK